MAAGSANLHEAKSLILAVTIDRLVATGTAIEDARRIAIEALAAPPRFVIPSIDDLDAATE